MSPATDVIQMADPGSQCRERQLVKATLGRNRRRWCYDYYYYIIHRACRVGVLRSASALLQICQAHQVAKQLDCGDTATGHDTGNKGAEKDADGDEAKERRYSTDVDVCARAGMRQHGL